MIVFVAFIYWTFYIFDRLIDVAAKKAVSAAFWSMMIVVCGAVAVAITGYVDDNRLIIAAMLGAFLGTYGTIKYRLRKDGQDETTKKNCAEKTQS
jgi:uncharacterized membrane protein